MKTTFTLLAVVFGFLALTAEPTVAEDWRSFQNGGSIIESKTSLPLNWSPESGISWQLALRGYGQSTPVSDGNLIYVTSVSGDMKDHLHVQAVDPATGKEAWHFEGKNSTPEKSSSYISRAAASPVCDENGVIAFFEGGDVVALDRNGKPRWELNLVEKYGAITARHGLASSLEQNDDHVFVWIERESNPYVAAISKSDGNVVWKSDGLGVTTWASPRLIRVGEGYHLVLSGSGKIAGFDPKTGKRLWDFDQISGNSTPTPIPVGDGRFLMGASAGREGSAAGAGKPSDSNGVIQISANNDGAFSAKWHWQAERATSSFGSPVAYSGHAYFVNRVGAVYCLDIETGKEVYAGRSPSKSVWATPLATADGLYLFGKDGTTSVLKSGPELEVVADNRLWTSDSSAGAEGGGGPPASGAPVLYAATPLGSQLLFRRGDILYLVGKSEK